MTDTFPQSGLLVSRRNGPQPNRWLPVLSRLLKDHKVDDEGCWVWQRPLMQGRSAGYGMLNVRGKAMLVHRAAYEEFVGPIPEGHQIDHLCENRACINPKHLEPVLPHVNTERGNSFAAKFARQTHCLRGHEFTTENTIRREQTNGRVGIYRLCRECVRIRDQRRKGKIERVDCTECSWVSRRLKGSNELPCPNCGAPVTLRPFRKAAA